MSNIITREKAVKRLYGVINSGIIDRELEEDLQEIANCISEEMYCLHTWGADAEEVGKLFTSYREDLITEELKKELADIDDKYSFEPSVFEASDLMKDE